MDIEMLRHELEILEMHSEGYYKEIVSVCKRVIDAADVLPNKKEPTKQENDTLTYECYGEYNQAIDECTAILAKNYIRRDSLPTVEEILSIIDSHLEYDDTNKDVLGLKDAAQAIHERIQR